MIKEYKKIIDIFIIIFLLGMVVYPAALFGKASLKKELFKAIYTGKVEKVRELLEKGAPVNGKLEGSFREYFRTPLCTAIKKCNVKIVKLLIEKGANIEMPGDYDNLPVHVAASENCVNILKILIDKGAGINALNKYKETPLDVAVKYGSVDVLKILIKNKAVIEIKKPETNKGDYHEDNYSWNEKKHPLHIAAQNKHSKAVKILLVYGVNVNLTDQKGNTALHYLFTKKEYFYSDEDAALTAKVLIDAGADPNIKNGRGDNSFKLALENDEHASATIMVKKIRNINQKDKNGKTLVSYAVQKGSIEIIKEFIKQGADLTVIDKEGNNLLQLALSELNRVSFQNIKYIINTGIAINTLNKKNQSLLHLAAQNSSDLTCEYLIKKGLKVNQKDNKGNTALHYAVERGSLLIVRLLLKNGADVSSINNKKDSPFSLALKKREKKIIQLLIKKIDVKDKLNRFILHKTVINHEYNHISKYLIKQGIEVDVHDQVLHTPLYIALENGNDEMVKVLSSYNVDYKVKSKNNTTMLHLAAKHGYLDIMKKCLNTDVNVNAELIGKRGYNCSNCYDDGKGVTPLFWAVVNKQYAATRFLLKHGANVNQIYQQHGVLHIAVREGFVNIVKALIKYKAKINMGDEDGARPLHIAVQKKNYEIVKLLIKAGANLNSVTNNGLTPLDLSKENSISQLLKKVGARNGGLEKVIAAVKSGSILELKKCIKAGYVLDGWIGDKRPIEIAIKKNNYNMVRLFLKNGVMLIIENSDNEWLYEVVKKNNYALTKLLLKYGSDPNKKDYSEKKPLYYALKNNNTKIAKLLIKYGTTFEEDKKDLDDIDEISLAIALKNKNKILVNILIKKQRLFHKELIFYAAEAGFLDIVKKLQQKGADINQVIKYSYWKKVKHGRRYYRGLKTTLTAALEKGHKKVALYLIKNGVSLEKGSPAPICFAAEKGYVDIVQMILKKNPALKYNEEESPFYYALKGGSIQIVKILYPDNKNMAASSNPSFALKYAIESGNIQVVKYLIQKGYNVNQKLRHDDTPLHEAVTTGNMAIIQLLVEHGADVNAIGSNKETPVFIAIKNNKIRIARLLVKSGANVFKKNYDKKTLLHIACENGSLKAVEFCLQQGLSVNSITKYSKMTPLHYALDLKNNNGKFKKNLRIVKQLLKRKCNVNIEDKKGNTPLMIVLGNKYKDSFFKEKLVDLLLKKGALLENSQKKHLLAYILKSRIGFKEKMHYIVFLIKKGYDVNKKDQSGNTILHLISEYDKYYRFDDDKNIVKSSLEKYLPEIIELGANVNAINNKGKTPLDKISYEYEDIIKKILKANGAKKFYELDE